MQVWLLSKLCFSTEVSFRFQILRIGEICNSKWSALAIRGMLFQNMHILHIFPLWRYRRICLITHDYGMGFRGSNCVCKCTCNASVGGNLYFACLTNTNTHTRIYIGIANHVSRKWWHGNMPTHKGDFQILGSQETLCYVVIIVILSQFYYVMIDLFTSILIIIVYVLIYVATVY